jgi:hypothetical protein
LTLRSQRARPGEAASKPDAFFNEFEITYLREMKRKAELGFLSMPLFEPPKAAHWGKFNDRALEDKAVNELLTHFSGNVDNCTESTSIDVVVRKGWLEEGLVFHDSIEGMRVEKLNKLAFSEDGEKAAATEKLWVLGGNHRRKAVKEYVESKQKARQAFSKQLETATRTTKNKTASGGPERVEDGEEIKEEMERIDVDIAKASQWAIRVYDRGE